MNRKSLLVQNIITGVLIICALAIAFVAVHREFLKKNIDSNLVSRKIKNWKPLLEGKHVILGSPNARLKIVEFSDYQCHYCRDLDPKLTALINANPNKLALIRYNLPLGSIHEYAYKAAIAAECASRQGVYEPFQKMLYKANLAKIDWEYLAYKSDIHNTDKFISCLQDNKTAPLVDSDLRIADEFGIDATPILVINGNVIYGTHTTKDI